MSLSTDVLSRATPTRLYCRGGRWTLELTRLEAVDRDVFQPRLSRLEGPESILAALRRSDEGQQLVSGAQQLMRTARHDEDRAFEVSEGDWIPSADATSPNRPLPQGLDVSAALEAVRAVGELRAELAVLRASHARLRDRVIALEAAQSGISQPNLRGARAGRLPRRRSEPPPAFTEAQPAAEPLANNVGFAATQASPMPQAAQAVRPLAAAEPALVQPAPTFEELAKSLAGEQPLPVLKIPTIASLSDCLATLMGSTPELVKVAELSLGNLDRPHGCKLLDDEGRERGAVILDLKAAVLLGAALLALPRDEALRQVRENDPSEDALLAMSEICNNLTGPVNSVAGNAHVRSTALTSVDVSTLPRPRVRLDLAVDGGSIVVAMF
jgi:hypothetical protein